MNKTETTSVGIEQTSIETVERRVRELLTHFAVLSLHDLCTALVGVADAKAIRSVLADMIAHQEVKRQADHRGIWYLGYALTTEPQGLAEDEIPAPFRAFLSELAW